MQNLEDYIPEEFGANKDNINSLIMEQASESAEALMMAQYGQPIEYFVEPDVEEGESVDEDTSTRYKEEFISQFTELYDHEYDRIAEGIGFDFCAEDGIRKMSLRKFVKGQAVYWNDPDGETSGEYKVLDPREERNEGITEKDITEFDDRMILISNGSSEADVFAQELDILKTKIIFRKFKQGGDIIALFPEQVNRGNLMVSSYMHVGQHSGADYIGTMAATTPTKESEYADLLSELKRIGYDNIEVARRCNPKFN